LPGSCKYIYYGTKDELKPGFFISEGAFYIECKVKEMKIFVCM